MDESSGTARTADITTWRSMQPLLEELVAQVLAPWRDERPD